MGLMLMTEVAGADVVRTCVATKNQGKRLKGSFRQISSNGSCLSFERFASWNSDGPAGPQGPMGLRDRLARRARPARRANRANRVNRDF